MTPDELVDRFPRLHHLAEGSAWPSIQRHGLLSTQALVQRWEVPLPRRERLLGELRRGVEMLDHPDLGQAVIRDQHPMNGAMLDRALTDMDRAAWLRLLNSMVFFSPNEDRLHRLYRAYRDRPALVLTLTTARLVATYGQVLRLARLNTGAVRHVDHRRGNDTFTSLATFPHPVRDVAEVAVPGAVPDITDHVVSVERWLPDGQRKRVHP